jgi:hypothetical protein
MVLCTRNPNDTIILDMGGPGTGVLAIERTAALDLFR